jgi:hypothetical protein
VLDAEMPLQALVSFHGNAGAPSAADVNRNAVRLAVMNGGDNTFARSHFSFLCLEPELLVSLLG